MYKSGALCLSLVGMMTASVSHAKLGGDANPPDPVKATAPATAPSSKLSPLNGSFDLNTEFTVGSEVTTADEMKSELKSIPAAFDAGGRLNVTLSGNFGSTPIEILFSQGPDASKIYYFWKFVATDLSPNKPATRGAECANEDSSLQNTGAFIPSKINDGKGVKGFRALDFSDHGVYADCSGRTYLGHHETKAGNNFNMLRIYQGARHIGYQINISSVAKPYNLFFVRPVDSH